MLVAKDNELQREVALKEIRPDYSDNADCRARFMREAEITGRLEHPGIVPVYSLGKYPDGSPYYAMRFIRGTSLQDAVKKFHSSPDTRSSGGATQRNLELRRLVQRLVDVCETMDYAHSRGVLHRDIKPGNIMLGAYGETLVVDWGLAKPIGKNLSPDAHVGNSPDVSCAPAPSLVVPAESDSEPTRLGAAVGTPAFMSPEQAIGRHDALGPASDVFSLGATLYQVLTGVPPYHGKDLVRQAERASFAPPRSINRHVPRSLEAICLKAMAAQPKDRYASAGELAQDLERYLADEPVLARPDRGLDHLFRFARRHRAWAQAGALALGIIALVATLAAISIHGSLRRVELAEESAVQNLQLAEAARQQEAARAEAEAVQRRRAEGAEEMARLSAERATAERDRAEREKRIVEMIVAEHAPSLLRMPGEYFADRQSLADFTAALVTARQADAESHGKNREALATFARLLSAKNVYRDDGPTNPTFDRYLFEKVVLPALSVPVPSSATLDDKKHLSLLWAAKGRLIERNPVQGFLAAAGIKLDDAADEFTAAMQAAHAAYRRSYEQNPDPVAATGSLRTWCKLPPSMLDWPRYEAELSELSNRFSSGPEHVSAVLQLGHAIKLLRRTRYAASPAEELRSCQEALHRLTSLDRATRSADPYALRPIVLITTSEACLMASRVVVVKSSDEGASGKSSETKFAWLNQALDRAEAAERDGPTWCRQAAWMARANVLEELAYHYKEAPNYQHAVELYEQCVVGQSGSFRALTEFNLGRCELRWALDAGRANQSSEERVKHLRSAYSYLTRAVDQNSAEQADPRAAAEAHFCLGQLLFESALEGPGALNAMDEKTGVESMGLRELNKAVQDRSRTGPLVTEIDERLGQIESAVREAQAAAQMAREISCWRWIDFAQQAVAFQKYLIEPQAATVDDKNRLADSEKLRQLQASVEELLNVVVASPRSIPIAQRRQLIELAVATRTLSSTSNRMDTQRYEKCYPENDDEALLQRVLLNLSDVGNSQVSALRQAESLIQQMKESATVNVARGHCEKFKADLLYGPYRNRVLEYVKSPDSSGGLSLTDDAKLRAIQNLYIAALRKLDGASDAKTVENLSAIYSMKLKDMESRRWPRAFSSLEADWLRRLIDENEPVRIGLYKLITARIYLHGKDWALNDAKQPLAEEGQMVARQMVECLKPLRFIELYFSENKLDDYQRQLLQICESRVGLAAASSD